MTDRSPGHFRHNEPSQVEILRLEDFIMDEVPGEPSKAEGAVDVAIRVIRERGARIREFEELDNARIRELEAVVKGLLHAGDSESRRLAEVAAHAALRPANDDEEAQQWPDE